VDDAPDNLTQREMVAIAVSFNAMRRLVRMNEVRSFVQKERSRVYGAT
jgi:ribosomal protein S25